VLFHLEDCHNADVGSLYYSPSFCNWLSANMICDRYESSGSSFFRLMYRLSAAFKPWPPCPFCTSRPAGNSSISINHARKPGIAQEKSLLQRALNPATIRKPHDLQIARLREDKIAVQILTTLFRTLPCTGGTERAERDNAAASIVPRLFTAKSDRNFEFLFSGPQNSLSQDDLMQRPRGV
jgi:hypothetical protein